MSSDFRPGDIVRHKSGGQDIIIIRLENESVAGATKKLAFCGRIERQNFHKETIPVEMLVFVNRQFGTEARLSVLSKCVGNAGFLSAPS